MTCRTASKRQRWGDEQIDPRIEHPRCQKETPSLSDRRRVQSMVSDQDARPVASSTLGLCRQATSKRRPGAWLRAGRTPWSARQLPAMTFARPLRTPRSDQHPGAQTRHGDRRSWPRPGQCRGVPSISDRLDLLSPVPTSTLSAGQKVSHPLTDWTAAAMQADRPEAWS